MQCLKMPFSPQGGYLRVVGRLQVVIASLCRLHRATSKPRVNIVSIWREVVAIFWVAHDWQRCRARAA